MANAGQARRLAQNKWPGILQHFGMDSKFLTGRHTACPICGDGKDRFRFDDKDGKGTFFCTQCGSGDGFKLLELWDGIQFKDAAKKIEEISGVIPAQKAKPVFTTTPERIKRLWNESHRITEGDEVWRYLAGRGLKLDEPPMSIRLHKAVPYRDEDGKLIGTFPAMMAMLTNAEGKGVTIHRTFLQDGKKAPVDSPRKLITLPEGYTMSGATIRLSDYADVIGVAEGIETALAANILHGIPVWSCVSTAGIESFALPSTNRVKRVVVFADNDENFAGQKAAYVLANKLVVRAKVEVSVQVPPVAGSDWADVLKGCA